MRNQRYLLKEAAAESCIVLKYQGSRVRRREVLMTGSANELQMSKHT